MTTKKSFFIVLLLIFFLGLILRLYHINELSHFMYDEARDATVEKSILAGKLTMLGPESRIGDKIIYFGPLHYYLMAPALALSHYNPMGPNLFTAVLGAITVLLIYQLTKNLYAAAFYAVFPIAVIYNRWAWNPNTIPLFATLFLLFLFRKKYFLAGILLGFCLQLHVMTVFLFLFLGKKIVSPKFILGLILGILPLIIFDVRHQWLYLNSYVNLLLSPVRERSFTWHYFLWTLPLASILIAKIPKKISLIIVFLSFAVSLYWLLIQKPVLATNPKTIESISRIISNDRRGRTTSFNVASFVDPVARATAYRYFLELDGVKPLSVEQYNISNDLYVVTFDDEGKVLYNKTYEVAVFHPKMIGEKWQVGNEFIYRLEK